MAIGCTLEPGQRLVLLALASHGGPRSKGLYPSVQRIAGKTGLSERTVQKHLHELEQLEVVRIHKRPGASNLYELVLDRMQAPRTNPPEPEVPFPATTPTTLLLTLDEMRAAMAFVAEAGTDTTLELAPELLSAEDALSPTARVAIPSLLPTAGSLPCHGVPVQPLHPSSAAPGAPPLPAVPPEPQLPPPGVQPLRQGGAAAAPELLSENLSKELKTNGEKARARDPLLDVGSSLPTAPSPTEVSALWGEAWAGRYGAAYTAERGDGPRYAFLAQTAQQKALTRHEQLLARREVSPGLAELARQYLTHLFGAYLAEPGQPTREGPGFLRWKKHPLRYLESDLLRLGEPWSRLDRSRSPSPPPTTTPSQTPPTPQALPPRQPHRVVIVPRSDPIPPEAMATIGRLLGRLPPPATTTVRPPLSIEELRATHGPNATEQELLCLARADQQRWAYQQRQAHEQREAEQGRRTG